jgi:CRISPR-associated protein Csm4
MDFDIIRLDFSSPLHISTGGNYYDRGDSTVRSDTIYSAIIQQIASFDNSLAEKPEGFVVSSCFPFTKNTKGEIEYFFPKPSIKKFRDIEKSSSDPKRIKKIKWINKNLFERVLKGDSILPGDLNNAENEYLPSSELPQMDFIKKDVQLRIAVPRTMEDTEVYYLEKTWFAKNSGLFFLVKYQNLEIKRKVQKALELLELSGIGTDRSVGMGQFKLELDNISFDLSGASSYSVNLSLFLPEDKNFLEKGLDSNCSFELIKRGGWLTDFGHTTYRKNMVYMFQEGSIFKTEGNQTEHLGGYVDLRPKNIPNPINHSVWRIGRSIFLPIKL